MDITKEFENENSFLHWFIICSLVGVKIEGSITECPRNLTMQLNGNEINPLNAIARLEEQFESLVKDKAIEIVEEIKAEILEPFEETVEELTNQLNKVINSRLSTAIKNTGSHVNEKESLPST